MSVRETDFDVAMELLHEVKTMMRGGHYMSSYEARIIAKLESALKLLESMDDENE